MASSKAVEDLILLLFVDSILRTGIVSDSLTSAKSNSELVRSLESLLESALACPRHPSCPSPSLSPSSPASITSAQASSALSKDSAAAAASSSSSSAENGSRTPFDGVSLTKPDPSWADCEAVPSYSAYTLSQSGAKTQVVTIPAQEAILQEPAIKFSETREALDVTAKFFYLPPASASASKGSGPTTPPPLEPEWIADSLEHLRTATGLTDIDTFIISFPGLAFDEDNRTAASSSSGCDGDANARSNGTINSGVSKHEMDQQILSVWKAASSNKHIKSLGVSEFSRKRLIWLLEQAGQDATRGITSPTGMRRPRVGQINTRNTCDVPDDLVELAKKEDIDLLVHSDCSDFLPPKTFTRLLARHGTRLPAVLTAPSATSVKVNGAGPSDAEELARRTLERLSARWVLKYTVLIRDRAIVCDKGYIVKASREALE